MNWDQAQDFLMRESEPLHVAPPALLRVAATGEVRALIEWCLQQEQRFDQHLQEALFARVHLGQWPVMHEVMKFLMNWRLTSAVALIDSLKALQVPCPVSESEILTELCHVAWPSRRWYAWQHFAARLFGGPQMRDPFDPPKWAE
jgi:hypothetical protein